MINKLINVANSLDEKGFVREANLLDSLIKESSQFTSGSSASMDSEFSASLRDMEPELVGHDEVQTMSKDTATLMLNQLESERSALESASESMSEIINSINTDSATAIKGWLEDDNFGPRWRDTNALEQEVHDQRVRKLWEDIQTALDRLKSVKDAVDISDLYDQAIMNLNHIVDGTGD